ncbi:Fic family protein [Kitasatospora sp. NPDC004799]|uniref:Fic family protein n=1 Tax=Kitasatospora sp. NPDC004799 TaxID=3154460 RepID=UPI0033BE4A93
MPSLQDIDQSVLAEIDEMRDRLRLHLRTSRRWEGQLWRNLTARAIAGSNTIEGYAASVSDVEDIMVGEVPIDANETVTAEIEGYRQAMAYIQRLAEAGDDFAYIKGLLNALHFMMQGHHLIKRPGWWRTGPVYVTSAEDPTIAAYTAPDAQQLAVLADELVDWLNEGDLNAPGLVRASMAHLKPVAIHPWSDGNGRMSRAPCTPWSWPVKGSWHRSSPASRNGSAGPATPTATTTSSPRSAAPSGLLTETSCPGSGSACAPTTNRPRASSAR